jgi:hypothetical protein
MRIVFSRKGFDSSAGGGPSPIVDGRPISIPIPDSKGIARTTYEDLGLGKQAAWASRGRLGGGDLCHHDPMFRPTGECLFGQCGAAQTHLERRGVGIGDVFVFFGLFAEQCADGSRGEPHHRIFGYLRVQELVPLGEGSPAELIADHPHALGLHSSNDVIWRGEGRAANRASAVLRLTAPEGPPSLWQRPDWLRRGWFSYHDREDRWLKPNRLRSAARGQEFVADIGQRKAPREWLETIIAAIKAS